MYIRTILKILPIVSYGNLSIKQGLNAYLSRLFKLNVMPNLISNHVDKYKFG